ncbi:MAG TPA: hypothetical protein VM204_06040, partial [Gaiellaceae bacterium]|nr:hypothetical protein [Gaiellaceae bacterium]
MAAAQVYGGSFGRAQAERLLWRAGFGPRAGEADALAAKGLEGAVRSLTRPAPERLDGPAPRDAKGRVSERTAPSSPFAASASASPARGPNPARHS